jgi:Phosphatidylethanolamine-binding protein
LCVGRPRRAIASAGTTGTKASTPRRQARCVPPLRPRRRRPEYRGRRSETHATGRGVMVPRDQGSSWWWVRRARGPRRGERRRSRRRPGGCRWWWLSGPRPRQSCWTRLRAYARRFCAASACWCGVRLGPGDRRWGRIPASRVTARGGRGCARRRVGARLGYRGPCPPPRHGRHRYSFRLYALDSDPDLPPGAGKRELERALDGHTQAVAELIGTYER